LAWKYLNRQKSKVYGIVSCCTLATKHVDY
jgi:hypothetical protein